MAVPSLNGVNKFIGRQLNKAAKSNFIVKRLEAGFSEPAKFAAAMLITSIVSKDLIGCVLYTTQSLHNKEIPEEKRKFVASLDLMNGILMVGGQLLIGKLIEKQFIPEWFGKYFSGTIKDKHTSEETPLSEIPQARLAEDNLHGMVKDALIINDKHDKPIKVNKQIKDIRRRLEKAGINFEEIKKLSSAQLDKEIQQITSELIKRVGKDSKKFKAIEAGFCILAGALATTALTKRTIVPMISTPLASWYKERFMDKKNQKPTGVETNNTVTPDNPKTPQDEYLDHTVAPWTHTNKDGDKAVFNSIVSR
ncbi:MAG: hypothetical protein PHC64_03060 [Candidatus Gastranaerophilales bacterium]|nr:hypothetical protein [Candidatus Gastranaerophilales bacterium]